MRTVYDISEGIYYAGFRSIAETCLGEACSSLGEAFRRILRWRKWLWCTGGREEVSVFYGSNWRPYPAASDGRLLSMTSPSRAGRFRSLRPGPWRWSERVGGSLAEKCIANTAQPILLYEKISIIWVEITGKKLFIQLHSTINVKPKIGLRSQIAPLSALEKERMHTM